MDDIRSKSIEDFMTFPGLLSRLTLDLQPQLDQPANGFGA
jgi:hypothetical protein